MAETAFNQLIQICPNDGPPFLDIVRVYRKAATSLGLGGADFFLSPSTTQILNQGEGVPQRGAKAARYLDCEDLKNTAALARRLRQALPETGDSLVLCHRYRAYKSFVATGLDAARLVALAHEYGFLRRRRRRWARRLSRHDALFAGVSPGVAEELKQATGS
ncbi:MAG: hypothetical protein F4X31_01265, partial [Gammaproteobacteria bacterium]|nr:hypothetical protein [Gammaproteobacteria bacterium]